MQLREHIDGTVDPDDAYASLTPEELGEHALRAATQSGWPPSDSDAHSLGAAQAIAAPLFADQVAEASEDLLLETLELADEYGAWADLGRGGNAAFEREEAREPLWSRDIDLHQDKVVEASLFDAGSEETVHESRAPRIVTDNSAVMHTRGVRRARIAH